MDRPKVLVNFESVRRAVCASTMLVNQCLLQQSHRRNSDGLKQLGGWFPKVRMASYILLGCTVPRQTSPRFLSKRMSFHHSVFLGQICRQDFLLKLGYWPSSRESQCLADRDCWNLLCRHDETSLDKQCGVLHKKSALRSPLLVNLETLPASVYILSERHSRHQADHTLLLHKRIRDRRLSKSKSALGHSQLRSLNLGGPNWDPKSKGDFSELESPFSGQLLHCLSDPKHRLLCAHLEPQCALSQKRFEWHTTSLGSTEVV